MKKRFSVISIHYTNKCNLNPPCPFCYKKQDCKVKEKPLEFWYKLVPYLSKLTEQIALGGGETFTNMEFIKKFSKKCKKYNLIINITSNGRLLMDLSDTELKKVLRNITMISLSYDSYKIKNMQDLLNYIHLVKRIKKLTKTQVGSNLLVDDKILKTLIKTTDMLFRMGVDRVFALIMKNYACADILKFKKDYQLLTIKHRHFYIDDCSRCIIENNKYSNWKNKCHRGKGLISINEDGGISSCSFAKPFTKLKQPKDILNLKIPKKELGTNNCPFLNRK